MEFFSIDGAAALLSQAAQANLTEKLVIAALIWRFMEKKVSTHLRSIAEDIASLKAEMTRLAPVHDELVILKDRVSKLEQKE